MMNEQQLINSIINFDGDIAESVNIIKNTAPEFLVGRYSTCSVEYLDAFLAIINARMPELINDIKGVYSKYLDKNNLYILWASYIVGKPLEVDDDNFRYAIIDAKNRWLLSVVISMDETIDMVEVGDFKD